MTEKSIETMELEAIEFLTKGIRRLNAANHDERSRELSVAITQVETGMMWLKKDIEIRNNYKGKTR